eukprot:563738-Pleurochrysis_carterae.AAC.1
MPMLSKRIFNSARIPIWISACTNLKQLFETRCGSATTAAAQASRSRGAPGVGRHEVLKAPTT